MDDSRTKQSSGRVVGRVNTSGGLEVARGSIIGTRGVTANAAAGNLGRGRCPVLD